MKRAGMVAAAVAATWLVLGSAAHAASITSGVLGSGRGCTDAACFNVTLLIQGGAGVTGTLALNPATLQLDFDLTVASAVFNPLGGGSDNGVTSLEFQNVSYQGTASLTFLTSTSTWMITGGSADIDGTAVPTGAGSPAVIDVTTPVSGSCQEGASSVTCGIIFSSSQFAVGVNGATRYFSNTANVSADVPEPAGLGLLGLAVGALGVLRSRRRS